MQIYAIYRGDELLDVGTTEELAERFNVKTQTIQWMASPTNLKRVQERKEIKGKYAIRVESKICRYCKKEFKDSGPKMYCSQKCLQKMRYGLSKITK